MPVVEFLKMKGVAIHGHILIWGNAKPYWIYDCYCPESEKFAFDALGISRRTVKNRPEAGNWTGDYNRLWTRNWAEAYVYADEDGFAAMAPVFTKEMRRLFRKRVFDVANAFGGLVDSWDVVNESSQDWVRYRRSRTGLPVWKSTYGLMPGDYPLHALLDAKEAFPTLSKLAINDYNISEDFLAQVRDLEYEGARIDIVGCQMHIFDTNLCARLAYGETNVCWVGTPGAIRERLDMMAKTGRPLHISEVTIAAPGTDAKSREIQAVLTRNIYRAWFSHPKAMGITWWNTVDGGGVKGEPLVSGLFTPDMKRKPVYDELDNLINREWKTKTVACAKGGKVEFRGFRGRYNLSWNCPECGQRHVRRITLVGNGVSESSGAWTNFQCRLVAHSFLVDGKSVVLDPDETLLVLKRIYPNDVVLGQEGKRWAELEFGIVAERAGTYSLDVHNDYFGRLSVNGGPAIEIKGPWEGYTGIKVELKAGTNHVKFRTRSGLGGKWTVGFRVSHSDSLKFAELGGIK